MNTEKREQSIVDGLVKQAWGNDSLWKAMATWLRFAAVITDESAGKVSPSGKSYEPHHATD